MKISIGTKTVLFGYHQFLLHPLFLAVAWWRLYGFPRDPRLWAAFFVHDVGYWGKPNLDGAEGESHPLRGAELMGRWFDKRNACRNCRSLATKNMVPPSETCWDEMPWGSFTLLHSRFLAKKLGRRPSRLCVADKHVALIVPWWVQLFLMNLTGEVHEYMAGQDGRTPGIGMTQREWLRELRAVLAEWIKENK